MADTTAARPHVLTFQRSGDGSGRYFKQLDAKVAYSIPLSDLVIADYTESGAVRGVEFVGKQVEPIDHYLKLAAKMGTGPMRKTRGPIPGARKSA